MEKGPQSQDMDFIPDYATILKIQQETVMSEYALDDSGLSCRVGVDKQQSLSPATIILYFLIIACIFKHFQCIVEFLLVNPEKQTRRHLVASGSPSSQTMTLRNSFHGWLQLHTFSH